MRTFQEMGQEIDDRGVFVGCPVPAFESTARDLFFVALIEGLLPSHRVLEIGSGCLRTGFWFIHFLKEQHYSGIEPNRPMLDVGLDVLLEPRVVEEKRPRFITEPVEPGFELPFDDPFDFFVSFSTWSHAAKPQIETMLDCFSKHGVRGAKFITSYFPAPTEETDYLGQTWIGRSHISNQPGVVAHSPQWVQEQCRRRKLDVRPFPQFKTLDQSWLVVEHQKDKAT